MREGRAHVKGMSDNAVFYNPVMEMNRDLSVIAIQIFQQKWAEELKANASEKRRRAEAARDAKIAKGGPEPPPLTDPRPHPSMSEGLRVLDALSATGLRAFRCEVG